MPITCVRTDDGVITTLQIAGQLDAGSAPELGPTIDLLVAKPRTHVMVDLGGLDQIDAAGAAALVDLHHRIRATGAAVALLGLQDQPTALLTELGLASAFQT